jgi:hypothetical protein
LCQPTEYALAASLCRLCGLAAQHRENKERDAFFILGPTAAHPLPHIFPQFHIFTCFPLRIAPLTTYP